MKDLAVQFGRKLRAKRKILGISQDKMALLAEMEVGLSVVKSTLHLKRCIN